MAKQQVNVYIDDASISVLVTKGRQPEKWSVMTLDPGLVKEGVVQDQKAVADKIKEIWHVSHIMRRRVGVGISGLNCLYQMLLLPELPENLRAEAIAREAAQSLGIPLEGVYLSWQILSIEHGQMRVYLAVLPKDKVDSVVATLKLAGLRTVAMDVKPLCLARAASEARSIVVDTCQDTLDIVVLGGGIPEVVRSLQTPAGTPPGERIGVLRSEMERSVSFYNAAHLDKPIDLTVPVLVCGDLVGHDSDMASLAGPRERPVRALESPLAGAEGFDYGKYMACIGLALKEILVTEPGAVAYSIVNFDALPEIYRVKKRPLTEVLWLPTVLVGVVVIGMAVWGIMFLKAENSDMQAQRDNINRTMQEQSVRDSDVKTLQDQIASAVTPKTALDALLASQKASRVSVTYDLRLIKEDAADSSVSLDSVTLDNTKGTIDISGSADTEDEVFNFGWLLEKSETSPGVKSFSTVYITPVNTSTGVQFSMQLTK